MPIPMLTGEDAIGVRTLSVVQAADAPHDHAQATDATCLQPALPSGVSRMATCSSNTDLMLMVEKNAESSKRNARPIASLSKLL